MSAKSMGPQRGPQFKVAKKTTCYSGKEAIFNRNFISYIFYKPFSIVRLFLSSF